MHNRALDIRAAGPRCSKRKQASISSSTAPYCSILKEVVRMLNFLFFQRSTMQQFKGIEANRMTIFATS
jgi:hypothetical protein